MKRVTNRHGVELLINTALLTIVEPMRGEADIVVLHFGRDVKAIVRGTLDDYAPRSEHKQLGLTMDPQGAWRGACSCGYQTMGWGANYSAQSELDIHTGEAD